LRAEGNYDNHIFMKQYVIDELRPADFEKIKAYLDEHFNSSALEGIYWISLDKEILNDVQAEHTSCQPFYFAINLKPDHMACELLMRTKSRMRCNCISYADKVQFYWFVRFIDSIFEKLEIKT